MSCETLGVMKKRGYQDLHVWQRGMDLCTKIYCVTEDFPKQEQYGLTSQMRRCAVSIPSNIAEGHNRSSDKDFKNFLHIAKGSGAELATQIEIAKRLHFITEDLADDLLTETEELLRMLGGFIKNLQQP